MQKRSTLIFILIFSSAVAFAQDSIPSNHYTYFPYPLTSGAWRHSIGILMTPVAQDIAEEGHVRAPAADYHVLFGLPKGFYLDGRANVQVVQNHFTLGARWAHPLNDKISFSVGDDFGYWFGGKTVDGLKTTASGWANYPNASLGFRISGDFLLTLKGEGLITMSAKSSVSGEVVSQQKSLLSGWAGSIMIEQPLYNNKSISLGVRFINSNFYWQTWSMKGTFDHTVFYPEIMMGFIF